MGNSMHRLNNETRLAASKFDADEIQVLEKTWQDLADRSNGKGIDKETFLQYFPLNGLLGDRLFAEFDVKGTGQIDFDEFVSGLAIVCRGTLDDKIHFIFNMYDVSHDKSISKQDLSILLNQVPKERLLMRTSICEYNEDDCDPDENKDTLGEFTEFEEVDAYTNHDMVELAFEECDLSHHGRLNYEEFKMWLQKNPSVLEYIESILPYNGPKETARHHDKSETLPHMKRIVSKSGSMNRHSLKDCTQNIAEYAGDIFNHSASAGTRPRRSSAGLSSKSHPGQDSSSHLSDSDAEGDGSAADRPIRVRTGSFSSDSSHTPHTAHPYNDTFVINSSDSEEVARSYLIQALDASRDNVLRNAIKNILETMVPGGGVIQMDELKDQIYHKVVSMEAYLWKRGKSLSMLSKRYYLLSGNCMYYYVKKEDVVPKGVIFLTGSLIDRLKDEHMELKGYYGFELSHQDLCTGEHHRHERRVFYCSSDEERTNWVVALQHAAHVVPIEDDYVIGKELGRGRFSIVCDCVNKQTAEHFAVKIIDKKTIEKNEKELLRTEIAVLKLVNHPNIIRMEGLYESKGFIYIVMELLKGGELFERIVGRPRFTEQEAAKLIRPLLESVAYLHDLGIVHRDLKPENILCGDDLDDLKIADFGLSKMILPKDKMDRACGTLSYVAPEVLTMQGYGKEADLWSVGVILFLVLCGKLPFDGDDHKEIIRTTIQAEVKVNPNVWNKLSDDAKSVIKCLLNKSPKERITARDCLKHPFLVHNTTPRRSVGFHMNDQSPLSPSSSRRQGQQARKSKSNNHFGNNNNNNNNGKNNNQHPEENNSISSNDNS